MKKWVKKASPWPVGEPTLELSPHSPRGTKPLFPSLAIPMQQNTAVLGEWPTEVCSAYPTVPAEGTPSSAHIYIIPLLHLTLQHWIWQAATPAIPPHTSDQHWPEKVQALLGTTSNSRTTWEGWRITPTKKYVNKNICWKQWKLQV